jgi:hypothetical protein
MDFIILPKGDLPILKKRQERGIEIKNKSKVGRD